MSAMTKPILPTSAIVLVFPLLLAGCAGADARPEPLDRAAQVPLIVGEVLRYEIHQFAPKEGGPDGVVCVAVREEKQATDPGPGIMQRLSGMQAEPQSKCKGRRTLMAGPVEWVRDDEVRVKGGYLRASEGETRLAYRVVLENGRWECVGPIVSWDPL